MVDLRVFPNGRPARQTRPPERGKELVNKIIASFPTCPIPEVARVGRTLKHWKTAILAYFDTNGASNGPAEAINGALHYGVVDRLVWLLDGRGGLGLLDAGWSGEAGLTLGSSDITPW